MTSIRILLADDHALVLAGIRTLLQGVDDFQVVGEAHDGEALLALVEQVPCDVIALDISMPGMNGLQAMAQILARHPEARIVILSMYDSEDYVVQALRQGARGYVLKTAGASELALAIRTAMAGGIWLSNTVSQRMMETRGDSATGAAESAPGPGAPRLTPRQREVLKLLADGYRTKEIAFQLGVSIKTVESYRTQIMQRLGVTDIPGLVRYAIREGLSQL